MSANQRSTAPPFKVSEWESIRELGIKTMFFGTYDI